MFDTPKGPDQKAIDQKVEKINSAVDGKTLFPSLDENIQMLDGLFLDVDVLISRQFRNREELGVRFCIYYCDGVVDSMRINDDIIRPLIDSTALQDKPDVFRAVRDQFLWINEIKAVKDVKKVIEAITYGDTLLLVEGSETGLLLNSKTFMLRASSEPESEKVLTGPREGFTEGIMANLSMVRRRLRTNELKMRFRSMGEQTATSVCVLYLDNIVNHRILNELYRRLETIKIDGVSDSNYITEFIAEQSVMGFPTCGYTERPDVVAAKLLEGRIAIVCDGTPVVLTLPYLFIENFQSNEDYYMNPIYATFSRLMRIMAFVLTISIPAIYIAIVAFHHEILQTALLINFANERQSVPLPASIECFVMLLIFDILRETGVRTPAHVGQALSIVGALVIGQSAVEAKLVAAPMIIVVGFTGITNLLVPKIGPASLVCRYFFLMLASMFGLTGLVVGCSILLIHLFNLQSFGIPSLLSHGKLDMHDVKDTFIRAPWPMMRNRFAPMTSNLQRMGEKGGGKK